MDVMLLIFVTSFLILGLGAVYKRMEEIYLTEPLVAMITGIVLGPQVLDIIHTDVPEKLSILKKTCEFTMAMALMATALRLPKGFFSKHVQTQTVMVLFGMLFMWIFSSGIFYMLLEDLSIVQCLLLGAIVSPTDPVLGSTIVSGDKAQRYLPESIRNTISFESGINDGLAFPIVFFSVFLLAEATFPTSRWLGQILIYETLLCAIIAYVVGYLSGYLMHRAHKSGIMTNKAVLPFSIGLTFMLLSGLNLLKMNGILGVFIGGLAFARVISGNEDIQEKKVQESMERITLIPVFLLFGLMIPWDKWMSLGWTGVWIVLFILIFRRLPGMLLLNPLLPQFQKKLPDLLILGWFGPIGVAALYYGVFALDKTSLEQAWVIPALLVFTSTVVHGISSLPLGKYYHSYKNK